MKTMERIAKGMSGKFILTALTVFLLLHFIILSVYFYQNSENKQYRERQVVIQKILNIVNSIETTPDPQRQQAVAALADPYINTTLDATPNAQSKFEHVSYWTISHALHDQKLGNFSISILLAPEQWLNIQATVYSSVFLKQLLFLLVELVIFGSIFISAWSIYRFTKPLSNFKQAADRLGIDLDTQPLDIYGPKIVRETATALNQMQQRIQELIRDRTQMLAAISHDLRTPITRLKLRAQLINDPKITDALMHDLSEMEQMVNETLSFAKQDATEQRLQQLDLTSLLITLCDDAQDLGHNVELISQQQRITVLAHPLSIKRALSNVINNATRYAKTITVEVVVKHRSIFVMIKDDGPGIPDDELKQVLTPFYRAEHSRNRETGGTGLGLAVTQDIIKSHHGSLTLTNRTPHGLQVTIRLPKPRLNAAIDLEDGHTHK